MHTKRLRHHQVRLKADPFFHCDTYSDRVPEGTASRTSGTAKLQGQEQYGYKDGRELNPDVVERLDGLVNVASLAAGDSIIQCWRLN